MRIRSARFLPVMAGVSLTTIGAGGRLYQARYFQSVKLPEPGSVDEKQYIGSIEKEIKNLRLFKEMDGCANVETSRPQQEYPEKYYIEGDYSRGQNLTGTYLVGPGRLTVPPYLFFNGKEKSLTQIMHVGPNVCGFPTIVHGGFLAILLDEAMGRLAARTLPGRTGVTASLTINYRAPTFANQIIVISAKLENVEGKKAFVSSIIKTAHDEPQLLLESSGLFVEPKNFKVGA